MGTFCLIIIVVFFWFLFVVFFCFRYLDFWDPILPGEKSEKTIFLVERRDWYYQSGDFHKWLFLGPIEQSLCKKYPGSVEQCKKPEERTLHLMKALHHKHISYFQQHFCLKLCFLNSYVWRSQRGKLNMKSSSNLSAFHLRFPFSKKYSNNRWHIYGAFYKPPYDIFRSS